MFDVDIDPQAHMRSLPSGCASWSRSPRAAAAARRVLLLDEPTSAISDREVERLYDVVNRLRDRGVAMLYTTHKMEEIRAIADRVVVLRDGGLVMDQPLPAVTDDDIVQAMIGRELNDLFPEVPPVGKETALEVRGSTSAVTRRLWILSVQAGRDPRARGSGGRRPDRAARGHVRRAQEHRRDREGAGTDVRRNSPAVSIARGMALVPRTARGPAWCSP